MFPLPFLWLIACGLIQFVLIRRAILPPVEAIAWLWIASMWAGWAGTLWLASSVKNKPLRLAIIAGCFAWHVFWMTMGRGQPSMRYAVMFGGYGLTQTILFRLFRVPHWTFSPRAMSLTLTPVVAGYRQFAIFELLSLTTITAVLITLARRYEPAQGLMFWIGLPLISLSLASVAALGTLATASPSRSRRVMWGIGAWFTTAATSQLLAIVDHAMTPQSDFTLLRVSYFGIEVIFAVLIVALALCGNTAVVRSAGDDNADENAANDDEDDETIDVINDEIRTSNPPPQADGESPSSGDLLPFRQPPRT